MENEKKKNTKKGCLGCLLVVGIPIVLFLLIAYLSEERAPIVGFEEYRTRVESAIRQIDDPNLTYHEPEKKEDGSYAIPINNEGYAAIFIDEDNEEYNLVITPSGKIFIGDKSFRKALALLIGTVDDNLSMGERELLLREMEIVYSDLNSEDHYGVARKNGISYNFTYTLEHGVVLEARK